MTADLALAAGLMLALLWTAAHLVFGKLAVGFLLDYAPHLPSRYVRQLQLRMPTVTNAAVDAAPVA